MLNPALDFAEESRCGAPANGQPDREKEASSALENQPSIGSVATSVPPFFLLHPAPLRSELASSHFNAQIASVSVKQILFKPANRVAIPI